MDRKGHKVQGDPKVQQVVKGSKVLREVREVWEQQEVKDSKGLKEILDSVLQGLQEPKVHRDPQGFKVQLVLKVVKVLLGLKELRVLRVLRVHQDHLTKTLKKILSPLKLLYKKFPI